ncbi:MAG: peptide deformylase [Oscillospiraceae bacterium]
MGLRAIRLKSDPVLRKKSRPVTEFTARTCNLLDDLRDTLIEANGLGLAAPQVGILRRAVVIVRDEEYVELVNPKILEREGEIGVFEGCLSCPNERAWIMRPQRVVIEAQDRNGKKLKLECLDMAARAACHEIDHLDGTLFTDLADRIFTDDELDELIARQEEEEERAESEKRKKVAQKDDKK